MKERTGEGRKLGCGGGVDVVVGLGEGTKLLPVEARGPPVPGDEGGNAASVIGARGLVSTDTRPLEEIVVAVE